MKGFVIRCFGVLLILAAINMALYRISFPMYYGPYQSKCETSRSYLFADSHGGAIGRSGEAYGVCNFSAGGDSYADIFRKIRFLDQANRLDTVYISADNHLLSPYRELTNNRDRSVIYAQPGEFENYYEYLKSRYIRYYIVLFNPNVRYVLKSAFIGWAKDLSATSDNNSSTEKAWAALTPGKRTEEAEIRKRLQFSSDSSSAELRLTLLEIISYCKSRNIKVIPFKFPVSAEYYALTLGKNYGADAVFTESGYTVTDFQPLFLSSPELFHDQDHLNAAGGRKLAGMLFGKSHHHKGAAENN